MKADLNVIDMETLEVEAPSMAYDLPAGGKRLLQGAEGYDATIVSGEVIYRNGKPTGALPGKLIRGPQAGARELREATHGAPSSVPRPLETHVDWHREDVQDESAVDARR